MVQSQEEMNYRIRKASRRKILRRQLELLAEWCRISGQEQIPDASKAMISVHKELLKTESLLLVGLIIVFFTLLHSVKRFPIAGIKLIRR